MANRLVNLLFVLPNEHSGQVPAKSRPVKSSKIALERHPSVHVSQRYDWLHVQVPSRRLSQVVERVNTSGVQSLLEPTKQADVSRLKRKTAWVQYIRRC